MQLADIPSRLHDDLQDAYPKTVLLFGSAARCLLGCQTDPPNDLDIFYVGPFTPRLKKRYPLKADLHVFRPDEAIRIAKSLRYHPPGVARAACYMRDTWRGVLHADIAACLLLGHRYREYGFLQMADEASFRDYSLHLVVLGKAWWRALQQYARGYRGPWGLVVDKSLGADKFEAPEK